jgi:hypothetical protein
MTTSKINLALNRNQRAISKDFEPTNLNADIIDIPKEKIIWLFYNNYREMHSVVRSGLGLCGAYDYNAAYIKSVIDTDCAHTALCIVIARQLFTYFGDVFDINEQMRIINILEIHDMGESNGDIPDDGRQDKEKKFIDEFAILYNKLEYHPMRDQLMRDFVIFEHCDVLEWGPYTWSKREQEIMQTAKLCDKVEAILCSFHYEKKHIIATLKYKADHFDGLSKQDIRFISEIDDNRAASVFFAHFIENYHNFYMFNIFFRIVLCTCGDVRTQIFPWLNDFLVARGLDFMNLAR